MGSMHELDTLKPNFRLKKRQRLNVEDQEDVAIVDLLPTHPLKIRPSGNAYADDSGFITRSRAGCFAALPDELLMHFLDYLDSHELLSLGYTCKCLFGFTHYDELWRALFTQKQVESFKWLGSWRSTYWQLPPHIESHISCQGLYSDVLHRPFVCAHMSLAKFSQDIPPVNRIPRFSNLTDGEYSSKWFNKPFILTEPVKSWPIWGEWTTQSLLKTHKDVKFRAEAVDWPLSAYVSYMRNNCDESPLYLFDRSFVDKMKLSNDPYRPPFWPPLCFGDDLFTLLDTKRPDHRWLILGPARSGSTFHKDPNATSAWNAVLTGAKYWLMFPGGDGTHAAPPPPGVLLSEDASEITAPLSVAEYLLAFHEISRYTPGCMEGICYAGEVLHVPGGWFHLVLNLEESLALTQNFVPEAKLRDVLHFLRDCPDQVSGFKDDVGDSYELFVTRLRESRPELLENVLKRMEPQAKTTGTKWERLTNKKNLETSTEQPVTFSFGFGNDEYEDSNE